MALRFGVILERLSNYDIEPTVWKTVVLPLNTIDAEQFYVVKTVIQKTSEASLLVNTLASFG